MIHNSVQHPKTCIVTCECDFPLSQEMDVILVIFMDILLWLSWIPYVKYAILWPVELCKAIEMEQLVVDYSWTSSL